MPLEVLSNSPNEIRNPDKPILFVHGMFHGAWCWEPCFLPYFEKRGIKAYALSLSNHGNSSRRKAFNLLRIKDYVANVQEVVTTLEGNPILVGHSMGGFIVQKYLEHNHLKGAVLLSPVPPFGIWCSTVAVLKNFPLAFLKANLTLHLKYVVNSKKKYSKLLFDGNLPNEKVDEYLKRIDTESFLAYIDMLGLNLVKPNRIKTPLLILGGGKDPVVPPKAILKTAKKYNTQAVIYEQMAHMMMLEPGSEMVADKIIDWVLDIG